MYSLYSFWHHNNKKEASLQNTSVKKLVVWEMLKAGGKKMKGREELILQSIQSSTPNLSPPYTLPLFHSTSTYSSPLFSSFAHFRLRNHFLRFFSTGAAIFHFPFANIFSFLQLQGNVCWIVHSHSYTEEMPKISLKKHVFGLVPFSMQPILETELTVKKKKKEKKKTCKQYARSQFLNATHLKRHARYSLLFRYTADDKTISISCLIQRVLHLIYPHNRQNIENTPYYHIYFSRSENFLN